MLINHDLQMIFIHAAKCAGISLSRWLIDNYGFEHYRHPDLKVPGTEIVERHRYQIPDEFADYEVFTCIREPLQRWESFYLYCSLQMQVEASFADFTRTRLDFLPSQSHYTQIAKYTLCINHLEEEVLKLPFVKLPVPEIKRLNASNNQPTYQTIKEKIHWSRDLIELISERFCEDLFYWEHSNCSSR